MEKYIETIIKEINVEIYAKAKVQSEGFDKLIDMQTLMMAQEEVLTNDNSQRTTSSVAAPKEAQPS